MLLRPGTHIWLKMCSVRKSSAKRLSACSREKLDEMEHEDRLRKLKWPTLETRRLFLSLVECYKIVFGINELKFDDLSV